MVAKRTKWVHIKVSEDERAVWKIQAEASGQTLADLIRTLLGAKPDGTAPRKKRALRRADPILIATLGRVGNNLNQLARWANTHKSRVETVQVILTLIAIERICLSYRPGVSGAEPLRKGDGHAD